jgi:hypothetical protein
MLHCVRGECRCGTPGAKQFITDLWLRQFGLGTSLGTGSGETGGTVKLRRTQITIETHTLIVLRRRRLIRFWCSECGAEAEFVPVEDLDSLLDSGSDNASGRLGNGALHFGKAPDGSIVVCVKSLSERQ